jgi:tRNA dimethylallyltransferase
MRKTSIKMDTKLMKEKTPPTNRTLIVLLGPTGVGKTELSIRLAQLLKTDIISADSRQIYADLKIGTAAPTPEQLAKVNHHFVGVLGLGDYYSSAKYEEEVIQLLDSLFKEKSSVLLTGGSMLYIDAVCKGIDDIPTIPDDIRSMMAQRYKDEGLEPLCAELKLRDPEYYHQVDLKNPKRIIHALEICYATGSTYSSLRTRPQKKRSFDIIKIGLQREREELYERINARVDQMMNDGLLDEAKRMYPYRENNSLNTVGYKELFNYFDGIWTLPFAIEKIKRNTRVYSRKQMTWFRHDKTIQWFHPNQEDEIIHYLQNEIKAKD